MIIASAVINTGRKRVNPAATAASPADSPAANCSFANDTTRMLFAVATPMHMMAPVSDGTLNVESLMGTIMSVGIAVSNSILLVSFANDRRLEVSLTPVEAALEAGKTRLRPVLMTALAMIIGMVPMALGFGEGGEQNAPLGRAVIGGLIFATVATLMFVPVVFSMVHRKVPPKGALEMSHAF